MNEKLNRRKFVFRGLLLSLGLVFSDAFWLEKVWIDWKLFDISKRADSKISIIQLSDLHLKTVKSVHRNIAKRINRKNPDLLLITGDSLDQPDSLNALNTFLSMIDISIPKFAILGNWEYWGNVDIIQLKEVYQQHNCKLLVNENYALSLKQRTVVIIGVDDFIAGNSDFDKATHELINGDICIVMTHCPQHRDFINSKPNHLDIDLVLSGHTHGGQINLFGYTPFLPRGSGSYLKGFYSNNGPLLYVSKGIGTSMLPIRIGSRAEVAEFLI